MDLEDFEIEYLNSILPQLESLPLAKIFEKVYNDRNGDLAVRVIMGLAIIREDYSNFALSHSKSGITALVFVTQGTTFILSDRLSLSTKKLDDSHLFKLFIKTYSFIKKSDRNSLVIKIAKILEAKVNSGSKGLVVEV